MPVTINGTTGIAGPDGSASTPAVQGTDSNTGFFFPAADTVAITTGGTQRVTVDSSGNVGIGTSSPGAKLDVAGSTYIRGDSSSATFTSPGQLAIKRSTDNPFVSLHQNDGTRIGYLQMQGGGLCSLWVEVNRDLRFGTNNTERARITTGGVLDLATGAGAVGQIQFPATQVASSNANTLDDYEEGTWTTSFTYENSSAATLSNATYTKVGRLVTLSGKITATLTTTNTAISITFTLPFSQGANICPSVGSAFHSATATSYAGIGLIVDSSGDNADKVAFIAPASQVTKANGSSFESQFSYTYEAAT